MVREKNNNVQREKRPKSPSFHFSKKSSVPYYFLVFQMEFFCLLSKYSGPILTRYRYLHYLTPCFHPTFCTNSCMYTISVIKLFSLIQAHTLIYITTFFLSLPLTKILHYFYVVKNLIASNSAKNSLFLKGQRSQATGHGSSGNRDDSGQRITGFSTIAKNFDYE